MDSPLEKSGMQLASKKPSLPTSRRVFLFLATAYALFVLLLGPNLATPLYHGYQTEFGFSPLTVTVIFAAYIGALIPSLLAGSTLAESIGRRGVIVIAMVLAIAASLAYAFAQGVEWLFAARILHGVAIGISVGLLSAAISEFEPSGNRHRASLVTVMVSSGGMGISPLLAGILAQYGPAPRILPFAMEVALLVPAVIAMAFLPSKRSIRRWHFRRPTVPPVVRNAFVASGTANFLSASVLGLFLSLVPAYAATLSGSANLAVAGGAVTLLMMCSLAAQIFMYGKTPILLQIVGLTLLSIGLVLLAVAGMQASLFFLLLASVIGGAGHGITFLGGFSSISYLAPAERHADILSSYYVVVYLGLGLPVIGVGLLANLFGLLTAMQIFVCLTIPCCIAGIWLLARNQRPRRS